MAHLPDKLLRLKFKIGRKKDRKKRKNDLMITLELGYDVDNQSID
jgi:hypothetical protein